MTTETIAICIRCGAIDEDGTMEFDEHANGFICDRCNMKHEICILTQ